MTYLPEIMQAQSFFQHMGEIFKMDKLKDVIGKTYFLFCPKNISDVTTVELN